MSFAGMRVLALESRRAVEIAELIRRQQGQPIVAPALTEAPVDALDEVFRFAERLSAGRYDMMIFLTGVGTRALARTIDGIVDFPALLKKMTVVARGPKPTAALREMNVPVTVSVPEPNTWRELLTAIEGRPEKRVAIQEYGRPNPEFVEALRERGCEVTTVRVYQYALPEDRVPLRKAVQRLAEGRIEVVLFTTAIQIVHLTQIAREMELEAEALHGLRRAMIGSIGPTTTEALEEFGLIPDFTPSHPKMGVLVNEAAEQAPHLLATKRST
jgi:uroporphyrinogen-III synthase